MRGLSAISRSELIFPGFGQKSKRFISVVQKFDKLFVESLLCVTRDVTDMHFFLSIALFERFGTFVDRYTDTCYYGITTNLCVLLGISFWLSLLVFIILFFSFFCKNCDLKNKYTLIQTRKIKVLQNIFVNKFTN